jgi:hypothetical protein
MLAALEDVCQNPKQHFLQVLRKYFEAFWITPLNFQRFVGVAGVLAKQAQSM